MKIWFLFQYWYFEKKSKQTPNYKLLSEFSAQEFTEMRSGNPHLNTSFLRWKKSSKDACTIFEHALGCRMIFDEEGNQARLHSKSQTLYTEGWSGASTWMHTMRQFLAWGSSLGQ